MADCAIIFKRKSVSQIMKKQHDLKHWFTSLYSMGYKPFFHAIRGQILVLGRLVEQTPPTLQLSTTPIDSCPLDDGQISPVLQSIRTLELDTSTDSVHEQTPPPEKSNDQCSISWRQSYKNQGSLQFQIVFLKNLQFKACTS